jgi:hypothetical protein
MKTIPAGIMANQIRNLSDALDALNRGALTMDNSRVIGQSIGYIKHVRSVLIDYSVSDVGVETKEGV